MLRKYKRFIKKINKIDVSELRRIKILLRTKSFNNDWFSFHQYMSKLQKYFNDNNRFEVNYYWKSCNWVYEFEFDEFLIYSSEFEKYFEIDISKMRKEKLDEIKKVVQK